jgi:hypothetical protein
MNAKIYVIGEIKQGVAEEVSLYKEAGLSVTELTLD